jgi:pyruvate dehydrogenase E1 component beta subunit
MATIETAVRELTYGEAVREAIAEEMRRDPRVFLIGEDVAEAGHPFKTLVGLVQEFGTERIIDTPISEPGYAGIGVGAAMTGMRPIVDVMFGDFITLTMDQMVNQAAKAHYMSGGKIKVPIVFRTTLGATRRSAAQHSQSLHAWVSHIPGLKVALPSGPYEAKGLMKTAIRDDSPVVIFEDKMMYRVKGPVPAEDYTIPFGVAEVKREGRDITIVATSSMVAVALGAATLLEDAGISAEVIDPRTTWPLDKRVRLAANLAPDMDGIIKHVLNGLGDRTATTVNPMAFGFDATIKPYKQDHAAAKKLLAEAGYPNGFEVGFTTTGPTVEPGLIQTTEAIAADLTKVGIRTKQRFIGEVGPFTNLVRDNKADPMFAWSWGYYSIFDADAILFDVMTCNQPYSYYCNKQLDDLVIQGRSTLDAKKRQEIYAKAQKLVYDDAAYLFKWGLRGVWGISNRIEYEAPRDEIDRMFLVQPRKK